MSSCDGAQLQGEVIKVDYLHFEIIIIFDSKLHLNSPEHDLITVLIFCGTVIRSSSVMSKLAILWQQPEVNPINRKARSVPFFNPFNKYGRVFFFSWFGFFIAFWSW